MNGANSNQPGAEIQADTAKAASRLFVGDIPDNHCIVDIAVRLDASRGSGKSWNEIAIEYFNGNTKKASSHLAQIRRYRSKGKLRLSPE